MIPPMADEAPFDPAAAGSVGAYVGPFRARRSAEDRDPSVRRDVPLRARECPRPRGRRVPLLPHRALDVSDGRTDRPLAVRRVRRHPPFPRLRQRLRPRLAFSGSQAMPPAGWKSPRSTPGPVRFQEETFGVRGTVSAANPAALPLDGPYDVVLACSFFSHLPAARFEAWLGRLRRLLSPGGVLIFSVHGMALLPPGERDLAEGIVFRPDQ